MLKNKSLFLCRVCGLECADPPWGLDGNIPSYNFCDCCGVEFGYGDFTMGAIRAHRKRWLESGANWRTPSLKPENWDLNTQFRAVLD